MPLLDPAVALSTRQEAFCRHYTASGNAADAARQAGYAKRSARQTGSALLERPYIVERVRRIRMSWRRTARDEAQEGFDEDSCARIAGKLVAAVEERESPPVCFELAPANDLPLADDPPEDRDFAPDYDKT